MSAQELADFEKVCKGCMSEHNDIRKQAEQIYHTKIAVHAEKFYAYSVQLLLKSQDEAVRTFCAVMLRQYMGITNESWEQVPARTQEQAKAALLELFKKEQNRAIRKKVSNCVGALAARCMDEKNGWTWAPLLPTLMEVIRSPHSLHKESVLDVLEIMGEYCVQVLRPHLKDLIPLLKAAMADKEAAVRLSALRAVISITVSLEDEERVAMKDLVPGMFQIVAHAHGAKDNQIVKDAMETLVNLVRLQPTVLRQHLKPVVAALFKMAADSELDDETRRMCMEFLLTLAETGKGMVRKVQEYATNVIPLSFNFMLELQDTKTWLNFEEEEEDGDQQNYLVGTEAIERLAMALGGKMFLTVAWPIIERFLKSPDWAHRHAALMGIAKMAEGCRKLFQKELPKFVKLIVPYALKDPNMRVQWAAVNALAQLASDFHPEFQQRFHDPVLPTIVKCMNPSLHPRLVVHSAGCLVDFLNGAPDTSLLPYLDQVLTQLMALLKVDNLKVQEAALSAVTACAAVADEKFLQYYPAFMAGTTHILRNAREERHKKLRGNAIECIGFVAKAVGKETFAKDGEQIMQLLLTYLKEGMPPDDPQFEHVVKSLSRICQCMGEAFVPYLKYIIPPLLKSASIRDACIVDDGAGINKFAEKEGYETVTVDVRHVGNRRITVNTSLLEEQALACNVLVQYAETLKEHFFPFVAPTAEALIPLITFKFNEAVRLAAITSAPALVHAAQAHFKKEGKQDAALVRDLWSAMCPKLIEALTEEFKLATINNVLDCLSETITAVGRITEKQMSDINLLMKEFLIHAAERQEKRVAKQKDPDFDEQEMEEINEEVEAEDEHLTKVYVVISAMVKGNSEQYVATFEEQLYPIIFPMMAPERSSGERCAGICIFDDIIAHGGARAAGYIEKFFPICLRYSADPDADVRQSAAFGVGACAAVAGPKFLPAVETALKAMVAIVSHAESRSEKNEPATDCAISAVGKICRHQLSLKGQEASLAKILPLWLTWLPANGDELEAQVIHNMLCDFLESNNPLIWGPSNRNLPKILSIFAEVLGTNLVTEETTQRIHGIWNKIRAAMPPAAVATVVGSLSPTQQAKLKQITS